METVIGIVIGLVVGLVVGTCYRMKAVQNMGRCKDCDLPRSCPKCRTTALYI